MKLRISKGPAADGSKDVLTRVQGRLHNLPVLPTPVGTEVCQRGHSAGSGRR